MFALFHKDYYCAVTLFTNVDAAHSARVFTDRPQHFRAYEVLTSTGHTARPLGYVHACPFPLAAMARAEEMYRKTVTYALFKGGFHRFEPGKTRLDPIHVEDYDDLQIAAIYPLRARSEKSAARLAWGKFLAGSYECSFWYDSTKKGKWTNAFGHTGRDYVSNKPPDSTELRNAFRSQS